MVELSSHNSVAILTFSPEPEYPRLRREVLTQLGEHLRAVEAAGCFKGMVIAANSRAFATGASLEEVSQLSGVAAFDFARLGQALFCQLAHSSLPLVAAIRGFCLGGGLDLALACRARVASYDASLGHPGATLGLLTGWGGTQRLPRLLGKAAALHILLTAERIPATQALTLGLVDELVPPHDLLDAACRYAERLCACPARPR